MFFIKKEELDDIEYKVINDIKSLNIDIINSKHYSNIDLSLDLIPVLYSLYSKHLRINNQDPLWINRDRVVLSSYTGLSSLIATLYMSGFNISLNDLKQENKFLDTIPGIDAFINNFGEGLAVGAGIAYSEKYLSNLYDKQGIFDYYTYVLCTDLDIIKGASFESLSFIKKNNIDKLIVIYNKNSSTFGKENKLDIDPLKYFESFGFTVYTANKNNVIEIDNAIEKAKDSSSPSVVILNGEDHNKFEKNYYEYNYELSTEEITKFKENLGVRDIPFTVSSDTFEFMNSSINDRMASEIEEWNKKYEELDDNFKKIFNKIKENDLSLNNINITCSLEETNTLLEMNSLILDDIYNSYPLFLGNDIDYTFRNGILSIQNGLSLSGIRNYSINNLSNVNYVVHSIKSSIKNKLANIYIFKEDEINSDNILLLRNIPGNQVYRPTDGNELIGIYKHILSKSNETCCIVLGMKNTYNKEITSINDVKKGAYIVKRENKNLSCILISSGNDLDITLEVSNVLSEKGFDIRVISMPSIELFKEQKHDYIEEILPLGTKVFVIDSSSSFSWYQFVYNDKYLFTSNTMNFDLSDTDEFKEEIISKIENLLF